MYCDNQVPAGITADKKGCNTMVSFTESGNIFNLVLGVCVDSFVQGIDNVSNRLGADIVIVSEEFDEDMQETLFMGCPSTIIFDASFLDDINQIENVKTVTKQTFLSSLDSSCCMEQLQFIVYNQDNDFVVNSMIDEFKSQSESRDIIIGSGVNYEIGDIVTFFDCVFCVAGKLAPTGMGYDNCIFVNERVAESITSFLRMESVGNQASIVLIKLKDGSDSKEVLDLINDKIEEKKVIAYGTKDLYIDLSKEIKKLSQASSVFSGIMYIVSLVALFSIITLSMNAKRNNFLSLDLLGVSNAQKVLIVFIEGILISFIGSFIGNVCGAVLMICFKNPLESIFMIPIKLSLQNFMMTIQGLVITVGTVILASIYSAYSVFHIKMNNGGR